MRDLPPPPATLLAGAALFLDFDGTLVELAETPDGIHVPDHLGPLLRRLSERLEGRIALISGRAIADLEGHVGAHGIATSGSHGLEVKLADGTRLPLSAPLGMAEALTEIAAVVRENPGLLVERKPASIAVHYRQASDQEGRVAALLDRLAHQHGFTVQAGKMVRELRPVGADKGDALRAFMTEPPFAGARPVFVGDDLTDEHAFAAAGALGGAGVLVGVNRPSAARYRLDGVAAVARWLEENV